MKERTETSRFALLASDDGFDPLEDGVRRRIRRFVEEIIASHLHPGDYPTDPLRYGCHPKPPAVS
ncbi:hypothetical protein [Amaricoccus sp.]|uniref:hypothetical protein n=1 Tax=Amaricoccus sp. TaxID=1872485 RepID=UPI001B671B1C|nr:hypothetical protein [Amaricoccus sp.]MBP7241476.1 hypothetical protein [Amaricoccus sp.]